MITFPSPMAPGRGKDTSHPCFFDSARSSTMHTVACHSYLPNEDNEPMDQKTASNLNRGPRCPVTLKQTPRLGKGWNVRRCFNFILKEKTSARYHPYFAYLILTSMHGEVKKFPRPQYHCNHGQDWIKPNDKLQCLNTRRVPSYD